MKRMLSLLLAAALAWTLSVPALAQQAGELEGSIVILHTNDIHGAIGGYAKVAALKDAYEARGAYVLLLDAGDFIQGDPTVSASRGAAAVELMNLAGYDAGRLRGAAAQAARMGRRLLRADASASAVLGMKKSALCRGRRLEKLLAAQTGERALGLCERQGVFLCRTARSGHVVAFCTQSVSQEGTIVTLQASAGFAARAALARPPFVSALEWMGSPLLPLDDLPLACRLLTALGAQRVLVVAPQSALRHQPDALEQASGFFVPCARELGENVGVFRIPLPETLGALSLDRILPAMDVGREAAEHGMEAALERIGMPLCRVLPFRRKLIAP